MKFSIFSSAMAQKGEECTYEKYLDVANSQNLLRLCNDIAAEQDKDKRGEMKKRLPVITWQAFFEGRRLTKNAQPSGLFMLDIDHVENPGELYSKNVVSRISELGIVYVGTTASRHGLRIVAKCRPEMFSLEECQKWLASSLDVEYDPVCKDFARCSFVVHDSYTFYMDAKGIWQDEADDMCKYDVEGGAGRTFQSNNYESDGGNKKVNEGEDSEKVKVDEKDKVDQREGLFGGPTEYKGVKYETICKMWLEHTGGEPQEGERNSRLYKLARRLRYIADFNEATMMRVMPRYGLPEKEIRELVRHAIQANRAENFPRDLQEVLDKIDRQKNLIGNEELEEIPEIITETTKVPSLPPLFRQWFDVAPEDFKTAVTLCQLPILGALGSRLRAEYLDGKVHSPSFQVSLEAPQASGKSFMVRLVEYELGQMIESDEAQREKEREYSEKVSELKMLNIKVNADNKNDILGTKPKGIIRYVPATMSITKLLMRMDAAQGLHLFAMSEEIDTVLKAFKRGFSSFSDALRVAFDNGFYGQDYASDNSWSGTIRLYYNTLFSGTPKAMRRFYPDVEDGLVSRVLFVTLPDQFGKPMPVWGNFTEEQKRICDIALTRLSEISLQGEEVQPEHFMKMKWLNVALDKWIKMQQAQAVKDEDRTRDIFCRRAAVVGFRAGMLAWFLWGEIPTPTIRRNVSNFAIWVANNMLNQHLLRFNIKSGHSNVNQWEDIYQELPNEFTRSELEESLDRNSVGTPVRMVIYKWKLLGIIEDLQTGREAKRGQKTIVKFKKVK